MVRFNPLVEVKELGRLPTPKGKFSLFYALELARTYQLINKGITEKKFRYLEKTDKKQRELVLELMGNLGMDGNAKSYGVGHLGVVQAFWDKEFPDMYRIVAFDLVAGLKPVFKGQAELPKTLELDIPAKLYFPHKYNKNANFGIRLPHLPPLTDYCPDNLREETCAKLEKWYNENYETEFELGEQLRIYCESDVAILMAAVLKFRKLFLGITKDMDVIKNSVTIAGVVMKVFRAKFLKERHIPIVPEGGYEKADKQSRIATQYFEWLAHREGVKGCAWHGCERCFMPWTIGPNGLCAEENLGRTEYKMDRLRISCKNFSVEEVWECDVKKELKRNREMKKFFEGVPDKGTDPEDVPYDGLLKLRKALELGYKVIRFYRAYHFEEFDSQLFKGLIAKLGLNSLWGKFSMRNTLSMTEIVSNMERYLKLDGDDTLEITMETMIREGVVRVNYAKKVEFIKEHSVSNIFLSLWTTSAARIKLYEYMEQVYRAEGCKLLYCDTDSLIFTHPKGPKQYSLKLRRKSDGEIWEKTKIRGMSLDMSNRVRYEEFKKMVLDYAEGRKKRFYYKDRIR
uniref:DNA-directed DNA polymerase n=1 Tax=Globodera pallida TaxID=36090 RepID=A0A183C6Y3_GLOPA